MKPIEITLKYTWIFDHDHAPDDLKNASRKELIEYYRDDVANNFEEYIWANNLLEHISGK
jgi:hypothetical protein